MTTTHDVVRALCKRGAHTRKCKNPRAESHPALVSVKNGCASTLYWRSRVRVQLVEGEKAVQLTGVGREAGISKRNVQKKVEDAIRQARPSQPKRAVVEGHVVNVIIFERAFEDWIAWKERGKHVSPETIDRYRTVYRNVIEDEFGGTALTKFKPTQLSLFLEEIPVLDDEAGLYRRVSYVKHATLIFREVFSRAVSVHGWLDENPMRDVKIPEAPANVARSASRALKMNEFIALREAVRMQPRHAPYLLPLLDFLGGTGVRIGEALALRRENIVEQDIGVLVVLDSHVVPKSSGSSVYVLKPGLKETKVRKSDGKLVNDKRFLNHPPQAVVAALAERLAVVDKRADALLFESRNGTVLAPGNVRRTLRALVKKAQFGDGISTHSFRKMAADAIESVMADDGASASGYIGNTAGVTQKHYLPVKVRGTTSETSRILDEMMREAAPDRYEAAS
ncbi:MAG TPA: tyrosine-type recombinase/integrase [Pseudolysinimonas sp.]|nr:tyrosine-type recombinase/integrase [Pseudolysinimonas sp.]